MSRLPESMTNLRGPSSARWVLGLATAAAWLVLAGIVGALGVSDDGGLDQVSAGEFVDAEGEPLEGVDRDGDGEISESELIDPDTGEPATPAGRSGDARTPTSSGGGGGGGSAGTTPGGGGGAGGGGGGGGTGAGGPGTGGPGDRTGVSQTEIRFGAHAPQTFDGVPLNLAEDPVHGLRGYVEWLNQKGGVNGRTINLRVADDRFTTEGAKQAADALIHDFKAFFVSGTLGIDQINVVSNEAAKAGTPYMAGGGYEAAFNGRMYQIISSYDTYASQLADFMRTQEMYKGKKVGIISSNSEFIIPVAEQFKARLAGYGSDAIIKTINKPQDESNYTSKIILPFKEFGVEVVVPLTDPISTSRIVAECEAQRCAWSYSFTNFAHDSDTALQLMAGKWGELGVRGLSGACYYQAPEIGDVARCAQMAAARQRYVEIYGEDDWNTNGSGGSAGYQLVWFWHKAMVDAGADPTRERFKAALSAYEGYADLITGPITFKGSANTAHGATQMVVLEAQTNERYRMINGGLVDGF